MKNNYKSNLSSIENDLCIACKSLIGKSRYDPPHRNLKQTDVRENKNVSGQDNEYYYSCKICSANWRHETGKGGYGWQLLK